MKDSAAKMKSWTLAGMGHSLPDQGTSRENVMVEWNGKSTGSLRPLRGVALNLAAAVVWCGFSLPAIAGQPHQLTFASPEEATEVLIAATRDGQTKELQKILGPQGGELIFSGDPVADKEGRDKFVAAYAQNHLFERVSETQTRLIVSADDWPFPIPLVNKGAGWFFDTKAGADEILNRRIGRNELSALQVSAAIVDAEHDYASKDRIGAGYLEYAQKFMSDAGKRNGLYWPASADEESPIGPLIVGARAEGYGPAKAHETRLPYHGYFYKIITRQGKNAPGGAYSYVVQGHMIGGFALLAFPAKYGDSGVMSFITNQDGVIYEKNLGSNTSAIARKITTFNPDASWTAHQ
jgi:hypothetical protein